MTFYRNFTVDLPARILELDREFRPIAESKDLEVSYLLMKLAASFLLPYERVQGTSGARSSDVGDRQAIRKYLELDKRFRHSTYSCNVNSWYRIEVDNYSSGPRGWEGLEQPLDDEVHKVLQTLRHAVAHSNLHFGGEDQIQDIYFGNRRENNNGTDKYLVIRCRVHDLAQLLDSWITNLQRLRVSPSLIWDELESAA